MTKEFEVVEIGKDVDHGSEIKETQLPDVVLVIVKNFCTFHVLCVDDIFSRFYTSHLPMKAKFKCQYQVCHVFKAITCKIKMLPDIFLIIENPQCMLVGTSQPHAAF